MTTATKLNRMNDMELDNVVGGTGPLNYPYKSGKTGPLGVRV